MTNTHKIIVSTYTLQTLYQIPSEWSMNDITIRHGIVYYQNVPKYDIEFIHIDDKTPASIIDGTIDDHALFHLG